MLYEGLAKIPIDYCGSPTPDGSSQAARRSFLSRQEGLG
jgi:hypothetical protein